MLVEERVDGDADIDRCAHSGAPGGAIVRFTSRMFDLLGH